ncbi:MAG: tetratricopeptide (TPR) repeat protein [Gammaproteobacteria bacterium]|jgi:tetratricopeptide (TPR) repeat protein
MIISANTRLFLFAVFLLCVFSNSFAQSVTVIGDSANARECYMSAGLATQMQSASMSEIESCNDALNGDNMKLRDRAATYINRGILYVAMGEYQDAIEDYAVAKNLYPKFGAIYVNRGNLFFIGESYDSAISEYSKALDLGLNQDYVAHLNRGMAYEKLGRLDEAETDYRQAIELAPEWKEAKSKLERVLIKIN